MPHVAVEGCRIWYETSGEPGAPALLLSHSLATTSDMWQPQLEILSRHFRVIRYDTRGHGRSNAPLEEYTLDRLGGDAVAVLDAAGAARAHVCGISIGGMTAMWLAIHAAGRVDRIVAANTAARIGSTEMWNERIAQAKTAGLGALADASMRRWFTEAYRTRHADTVARFASAMANGAVDGYVGCAAALRDADLRDRVGEIRRPTLIITGTHDPATTPADAEWLARHIEGSRLVELPAAHISNVEQAEAFTRTVVDFLAG